MIFLHDAKKSPVMSQENKILEYTCTNCALIVVFRSKDVTVIKRIVMEMS